MQEKLLPARDTRLHQLLYPVREARFQAMRWLRGVRPQGAPYFSGALIVLVGLYVGYQGVHAMAYLPINSDVSSGLA